MKNLVRFTIIILLFLGCKTEEKRTGYIINGNAKGIYNGVRTYLLERDQTGREKVVDTAIVFDEKFTFTGTVEYPKPATLSVNSVKGNLDIILENSEIDISIDKSNMLESKVSGSASHTDYERYKAEHTVLSNEIREVKMQLRKNAYNQNTAITDSLTSIYSTIDEKGKNLPLTFSKANTSSPYSLILIEQGSSQRDANIEAYLEAFNALDSDLKSSSKGLLVKTQLDNLSIVYQKTARVNIGKIAPNFEALNPDGKLVSLNDIKGKVTIIDFWAAWCGPCRRENPNVVRIYNKYHSEGLEIIGVSLDGTRSQNDPKQNWINAIEADKLTWTQVSNLQYFQDPIAQLYNINAIPAVFILDADGKIAAKNLRGAALESKVKELLQK